MASVISSDIHALNFRYLLLVQQAFNAESSLAQHQFGVTRTIGERLAKMSVDELTMLSKVNTPLFIARFDQRFIDFSETTASPALRAMQVESTLQ